MSARELTRAGVLARVEAGTLRLRSAATMMAISYRQAKRLYRRYRTEGEKGLKHRSAGRRSTFGTCPELRGARSRKYSDRATAAPLIHPERKRRPKRKRELRLSLLRPPQGRRPLKGAAEAVVGSQSTDCRWSSRRTEF
jgi:Helix-turn-helix domain